MQHRFLRYPLIADETVMRDEPKETLRAASEAGLCVIVPAKDNDNKVTLELPPVKQERRPGWATTPRRVQLA